MIYNYLRYLIFIGLSLLLGCGPFYYQPIGEKKEAELGPETVIKKDLLALPAPKDPIVVAVYKFRDQTGQYKPSSVGSSWSTAVTQGATNILIRALEESGWFVPIERENISNLLNERKIIRSSREQYEGKNGVLLPPLLFAGVLLEGGIVSYETNVFTGGAGLRYFGTDVSAQYREDRVSIYLRAVSTSNGKVLKTIYTTKSILSQEVSAGVFRYVKYKRLLEAEVGYTYNEPTEMAITEAVEKAVHSLIIEGVLDNLWSLADENQKASEPIQNYLLEKQENFNVDEFDIPFDQNLRSGFYTSLLGAGQFYLGDYAYTKIRPGVNMSLGFRLHNSFYLESNFGLQYTYIQDLINSREYLFDLNALYLANYRGAFSPYMSLGAGTYYDFGKSIGYSNNKLMPYLSIGGGMEYKFKGVALTGGAYVNSLFSDYFDGEKLGNYNDYLWGFKLGVKFYW